jgi:regulator of sirC expression with transglutaminase-like and TPR domain
MNLDTALALLARNPSAPLDLAEVALALARDEYPNLDVEATLAELAGMAHEVRPRLRGPLLAQVEGLCRYLFHEMGFRGDERDYYNPRNSYLNEVLERRTGIPITLSVVAMAVAERAGLTVVGVGLPGHFVVKAVRADQEILFDPYHGGRLLLPGQCEALVRQVTNTPFDATPEALAAVPLGLIVLRMLSNLKGNYLRQGDFARAARVIGRIVQLCPADLVQRRDLGASLLQAGRPGPAIDHLKAYLAGTPTAEDAEVVRQLLERAKTTVAGWN